MDEERNSAPVLAVIVWLYPIVTAYREFDDPLCGGYVEHCIREGFASG
jgi:hypothetical protein